MRKRKVNLDQLIEEHEEYERRMAEAESSEHAAGIARERVFLGTVERYYQRLGVAAITLKAPLRIGDMIEIGTIDEAIRQRVTSMQIERNGVESADAGSSVGIATRFPVEEGWDVFKILE